MKESSVKFLVLISIVLAVIVKGGSARPQDDAAKTDANPPEENSEPMPYSYTYSVNDEESKSYYGHEEKTEGTGRTEGKYFVWLADGRLMTVEYYVDGESGFVPKITFSEPNYQPPAAPAKE